MLATFARHLLADRHGTAFGYSSLVLLVAIAAIALIAEVSGAPN